MGYLTHALGAIALGVGASCAMLLLQLVVHPEMVSYSIAALAGVIMAALYVWLEPLPKKD